MFGLIHLRDIEKLPLDGRETVLDLYLFDSLTEVREITYWWMIGYNEERPHDALGDLTPAEYMEHNAGDSTLNLSP
jgi:putative transposase